MENVSNNPYVIVSAHEGQYTARHDPPLPDNASFGQVISFASFYQTSFRIELPLWHEVEEGITHPGQETPEVALPVLAKLTESCLPVSLEDNARSCRFVIAAPHCHFGAAVMERTLVTSSPWGGGGRGGVTACLGSSRPMSSAGHCFRKLDNQLP